MGAYTIRQILALAAALILAFLVFWLAKRVRFERGAAARVSAMTEKKQSAMDRYGDRLVDRLGLSLESWKHKLYLAQLGGKYLDWTVGGIVFRGLIYGGAVLLYVLVVMGIDAPLMYWAMVALAASFPFTKVNGAADDTKKLISRLLPETATVIAAEMTAQTNLPQAVERASVLPGPLGIILKRAVDEARRSKRPAFSNGPSKGVIPEIIEQIGVQDLSRFAVQLDHVASKGVETGRVMTDIARGLAREYKSKAQLAAAGLDSKLMLPVSIFFFIPFLAALFIPIGISILGAF